MAQPSISAVGLSKRYRAEGIAGGWLDALRDVSFDIAAGEGVGLIGRNGAGKSTLLRILSRVTRPSAGYADVYGRVGALLEVGTGFHPELTGRENTFLSGAILGMSRSEVRARFDEIVAFAEIEPFIDTPVKRYSSGMYARLGFAVAAHLRPSILIVDEVLAVGDLPFQAKCLAYMHQLTSDGTTVLFVSHNLLAVADLCSRALLMAGGKLSFDGPATDAISEYRRSVSAQSPVVDSASGSGVLGLAINGREVGQTAEAVPNHPLVATVSVDRAIDAPVVDVVLNLVIELPDGRTAIHLRSDHSGHQLTLRPGRTTFQVEIGEMPLATGTYSLWLRLVSIDPREPLIWDTRRTLLTILGDKATDAVVMPTHLFREIQGQAPVPVDSSVGR